MYYVPLIFPRGSSLIPRLPSYILTLLCVATEQLGSLGTRLWRMLIVAMARPTIQVVEPYYQSSLYLTLTT